MPLGFSVIGATLLAVVVIGVLAWPRRYNARRRAPAVQVLVLGDVGRSPRMQYHALSIAERGHVQLIGYYETPLVDALDKHPRLTKVALAPPPPALRGLPFIIGGPLKVVWQVADLFLTLAYTTRPARWLLVQNPPSIPTLLIAGIVAPLRGTRLVIDWHNYGWSILAGTRGPKHPFVAVAKVYESIVGRIAGDAHLAVTAAMADELRKPPYNLAHAGPTAVTLSGIASSKAATLAVLHDRPAALFQPAMPSFPAAPARLQQLSEILGDDTTAAVTALLRNTTTKIIVSSTSWTPDEDFQLLLDALVEYVKTTSSPQRPPILAVITGKGPQKKMYERKLQALADSGALPPAQIAVCTAFLPMRDYARLLALADLGVCLHMSSSGVDLPMKVVDMFGAGLPVAAYSAYASFGELVRDGENGRGFTTSGELASLLATLLGSSSEIGRLRDGARKESRLRWSEEWNRVVAPILDLGDKKE
ncbi:chitobiosyldiphosphodolichol beta-mannosyltransferase [Ophiostoma piceae UAMH 11346]|uniref:Chitobiosyldiphosphodolichol beta-mannosyltransferase n=1 Tax=Ophiostoma piceae (strain UAMH 11346) TaxID=1262450 RepID=S3C1E1_OPHP1|nr:chitobiosyldiphosphodolichol beta-mannosyltransferase [Ophiostoma piceae UAMH 11346]